MASYIPPQDDLPQDLYSTALTELKALGVKVPKLKKFKSIIAKHGIAGSPKIHKIFGVGLTEQEWLTEGEYTLPKFLVMATTYLQQFIDKEIGLFRKAGNFSRQRRLRSRLERGSIDLQDADPNDVASLLKKWLGELPEPLIPGYVQEIFTRCENLEDEKSRVSACLFAFMLLPTDHMNTLKYFMQFLSNVALNSEKNKMGAHNLALIMAPNVFRLHEPFDMARNNMVYTYTAILQILIENADKLGELPPPPFPQPCIGADYNSSADVLDFAPTKSKKKSRNATVQDIFSGFRKLVGQNLSLSPKAPESQTTIRTVPYVQRHTVSLDDLDSPSVQEHKGKFANVVEKSSRHARRKSFGELFLRRKERKRNENQSQEIDQSLTSLCTTNLKEGDNQEKFPLNRKGEVEDMEYQFNNLRLNEPVPKTFSQSKPDNRQLATASSDKSPVTCVKSYTRQVEKSKTCIPHMACKTQSSISNTKETKFKPPFSIKSGLIRKEAFSFKPIKGNVQNFDTNKTKDKIKENDNVESKRSVKSLSSSCLPSHSSINSNKSDKNNSAKTNIVKENTISGSIAVGNVSRIQSSVQSEKELPILGSADLLQPQKLSSPSDTIILTNPQSLADQTSVTRSEPKGLDLSVQLHLGNFCITPTNVSPEIHLNIDITSNKSNPELKMNVSNDTISIQKDSSSLDKVTEISRVKNTGKRLSSNSDSLIPRLKKRPEICRPNSFSGNIGGYQYRMKKIDANFSKCSKIPVLLKENKIKCDVACSEKEHGATNDRLFKTPEQNKYASSLKNRSQYLNISPTNEQDISYKRESIARILKENPGHVQRKVSLYDSKQLSTSSSNSSVNSKNSPEKCKSSKLVRASSEKYPSGRRYNKLKLSTTNSCNLPHRSNSVKYNPTFNRPDIQSSLLTTSSCNSSTDDVFSENESNNSQK